MTGSREPASDQDRLMLDAYLEPGATLTSVAERFGRSREWARQRIALADPRANVRKRLLGEWEKRVREAEGERLAVSVRRLCRACGGPVTDPSRSATCSPRCANVWSALKVHVDPDARAARRKATARYHLRSRRDTHSVKYAQAVVDGQPVVSNGRWLQRGGRPWDAAVLAYRNGWKVFDDLPAAIREQVVAALEEQG